MIMALLFWLLLLIACGYAAVAGGADGRWAAALIIAATILTIPATLYGRLRGHTELAVFAVDVVLLAGLYALTIKSRRWWPIWMTGFHLIAVVSHLSTALAPRFTPAIYYVAESFGSLPMLISMVAGVALDQQAAKRRPG